jgi:hypothetical protein
MVFRWWVRPGVKNRGDQVIRLCVSRRPQACFQAEPTGKINMSDETTATHANSLDSLGHSFASSTNHGAAEVTAVEGNRRNFLKCCAVKNQYQLNRTQYILGDCSVYLDQCDRHFDLVIAAGILYHLFDPIGEKHIQLYEPLFS